MNDVSLRLATEADNEQLLELTRLAPMDAGLELLVERSPRFFALNDIQGDRWYVAVAEDATGRIVASTSLALRRVYIDGAPVSCFYGGDLRVAPERRGGWLPRRLHDFLLEIVRGEEAEFSYAAVITGNRAANVLTRSLGYRAIGEIRVCVLEPPFPSGGGDVERPRPADVPAMADLLDEFNALHNLAPVWSQERLARALETTPGLTLDAFRVVREHGEPIGMLAAWNQDAFQRTRVLTYPPGTGERLPAPGELLRRLHVTHVAVRDLRPPVFADLLASIDAESYSVATFGLAERHPLLAALDGFRASSFTTTLYVFSPPDSPWATRDFSGRPPFHEISHI